MFVSPFDSSESDTPDASAPSPHKKNAVDAANSDPAAPGRSRFWTLRRSTLLTVCLVAAAVCGACFGTLTTFLDEIPLVSDLKAYKPSLATKIYDCKGRLITELFSEQRTKINLDAVPQQLQQAVLSIEDDNFYSHFGIEPSGILRSLMVNVLHRGYAQGGSTITQQLARNMFLTRRKTIERKIKEAILALQIERMYTKREILEMYLNQIYFGNGAYGVESAARSYFGKHVQELNLTECALLAGLPRSPNHYNPYRNPKRALSRRNLVIAQMQRLGYLKPEEAANAKAEPLQLSSIEVSQAPYFVEYVRRQLEDRYGSNAIYKGGLKVYTTLDLTIQDAAQDSMNQGLAEAEKLIRPNIASLPGHRPEPLQCALVVLDPSTGEIKALIGGRNFAESKFNRAVQAQRQPGSAFKPFIYATAFSKGFTQADIILDAPMIVKTDQGEVWKPQNFTTKFGGPTTLRSALTNSRNIVSIKLLEKVGISAVIELAHRMGISSTLNPYLTLALGASEVNLLELVSAYGVFPNHGIRAEPVSVLRVEDTENNVMEENASFRQEVLDDATCYLMTDVMSNVINAGTGHTVRNLGFKYEAAGKTGTTNDYTDAWFLGFTSEYVAGVWLGLDSHRSLGRGITGGLVAAPIWARLMLRLYADRAPRSFTRPDSITMVQFCKASGLLANPECDSNIMTGAFTSGTAPTQHCNLHVPGLHPGLNLNQSPDLANINGRTPLSQEAADGEGAPDDGPAGEKPAANTPAKMAPKLRVPPML